jgi:hypothetical protein
MRFDGQENVEITGCTAPEAGFAFASKAYARAIFDAGRNVDG